MGGFTSPQPGLQMSLLSGLAATMRPSPHTHGFNVRFHEQPTVHCFSPTDSANDALLRQKDLDYSEIKPGMTPILPDERSTPFAKWCDSRRSRVNDSEELRRKKRGGYESRSSVARMGGYESRSSVDSRRSSIGHTLRGSSGTGFGGSAGASSAADRWWDHPKWDEKQGIKKVSDYCQSILSESGSRVVFWDAQRMQSLAPQTIHGLEPAAALLEQTSRGIRRWIGFQVVRHVLALMDQVEKDATDGLHKRVAPKAAAPAAAPAPAGFGFGQPGAFGAPAAGGGGFGAPSPFGAAAAAQQQQAAVSAVEAEKARQEEEEATKRGNAFDRQNQVACLGVVFSSCCALKDSPTAPVTESARGRM